MFSSGRWIDAAIVVVFFLATFAIGLYDRKKVTVDDYWVNGRKTSTFALVATVFSSFLGAGSILGAAGLSYSGAGLGLLLFDASYFVYFILFALVFAPRIQEFGSRTGAYSMQDFLGTQYGTRARIAGIIVTLLSWSLFSALQVLAIGSFVSLMTGIPWAVGTIAGSLIVIVYTTIGGMRADIRTDIFQGIVMLVLLFVFFPLLISAAGGVSAIAQLPPSFITGTAYAPFPVYLFGFFVLGTGAITSADLWQRAYAGSSPGNTRKAMCIASVVTMVFFLMATAAGMYGKVLLPDVGSNHIIPAAIDHILPVGLRGLVLAGFFAAILSSADTVLLILSMTVVHDILRQTLHVSITPERELVISRWTTFLLGMVGLIVALIVGSIVHLSIEAASFYVVLFPAIVFGFLLKRPSEPAAFWSIVAGTAGIIVMLFVAEPVYAFIPGVFLSVVTFLGIQGVEWVRKGRVGSEKRE